MVSDAETIRSVASEEILSEIVFLRLLFEPEGSSARPRPAVPLGRRPFAVGRSIEGGVGMELRDPRASRRHAIFHPMSDGQRARIEDTSTNGTFVNGHRVGQPITLADGDLVRVGDSFLLVRMMSPASGPDAAIPEIMGRHPAMRGLRQTIAAVAPTDAKVLIVGESGTGKELVARAIHERSGRPGPFVAVNCSAIPESLAESQLFGHVAGAFTGAQAAHAGFMRAAEGGTLFLDEVGELTPLLQPKLLRALEEREVIPVGSTRAVGIDVRPIAATHRDLLADVDAERFRGDLYARVAGYMVRTLPLRERREDVLPLLAHFLGEDAPELTPELIEALLLHPYRFNVRELKEIATQLRIDGAGRPRLSLSLLQHRLEPPPAPGPTPAQGIMPPSYPRPRYPTPKLPAPGREHVVGLLRESGGNVSQVARALGRSRRQVYRYLEQWGLSAEDFEA